MLSLCDSSNNNCRHQHESELDLSTLYKFFKLQTFQFTSQNLYNGKGLSLYGNLKQGLMRV